MRHRLGIALLALTSMTFSASAFAQTRPSILVVRAPRVATSLQSDVQELLAPLGEIVSDRDYALAARRLRLSSHDPKAIAALLPGLGISLVVSVETITRNAGRFLRLSYRSPETADEIVHDELPYRSGPLPSSYRNWITSQARLALSTLSSRAPQRTITTTPGAAAQAWRSRARTRPPATTRPGTPYSPPEFGETETETDPNQPVEPTPTEFGDVGEEFSEAEAMEASEEELSPRVLQVDGAAGVGLGQRSVTLPFQAGTRLLDVGPFLVVDAAVRARLLLSDAFQFAVAVRYYTSVGLTAESTPAAGVSQATPLRSQRLEVTTGASFRLGTGETIPWLALHVGYAGHDLRSLVEITMPRYTVSGPLARLDLRAIIADGRVTLWAMPEGQWIASVDDSLTRLHVDRAGFAIGGELGLSVRINEQFLFEASYREAHTFLGTPEQDGFQDLDRIMTTRLVVQR